MGHVRRSVFTKVGVERAIHTTRIGLQKIRDYNLQSLDLKDPFNTISRRSFLAELYKNSDLHPIIPLLEMIYSRDSTVYYFEPNDASLLHGTVQSRTGVRQGDLLGPLLFNLATSTPLRNIGERCKDSAAIQAFSDDGKYLVKAPFVPTVTTVAMAEELGKVCSNVQQIKSSCMEPPDTAPELVEVIRAMAPVVTRVLVALEHLWRWISRWQMALTMRSMFILGCKTTWRLISSSWTRSFALLLCRTSEGHTPLFA
jgi:hypothetical protein